MVLLDWQARVVDVETLSNMRTTSDKGMRSIVQNVKNAPMSPVLVFVIFRYCKNMATIALPCLRPVWAGPLQEGRGFIDHPLLFFEYLPRYCRERRVVCIILRIFERITCCKVVSTC
nr:hypothetical protein [uncultured Pseudodesulfovibrio sp.]